MKNITYSAILLIALLTLTGCESKKQNIENLRILSETEKSALDLKQDDKQRERSIDDLCAHEEPLVLLEKIYNENDEMVQFITYEYDDKNRYTTVKIFEFNPDIKEMDLSIIENYSYDEYSYSKDVIYLNKNGLVAHYDYDLHGNELVALAPNEDYDGLESYVFKYKYPVDTKRTTEEYCYMGEGISFMDYSVYRYNEKGDETFYMRERVRTVVSRQTEYEYDTDGKMLSKSSCYTESSLGREDESIYNTSYSYNEEGWLIQEVEEDTLYMYTSDEINVVDTIDYQYDDLGRVIYKREHQVAEGEYYEKVEESMSTAYEYYE